MKNVLYVWKPVGWTPLRAVSMYKKENPEYEVQKISYAGRLDPMAEGVMILLVGEENKKRKEYEGLKKVYEIEIVLGITTDTFDALGLTQHAIAKRQKSVDTRQEWEREIEDCLNTFLGKQSQKFPPYSSKPVDGKPLFWWARNNRFSEIEIPQKEIEIYSLDIGQKTRVNSQELIKEILEKIRHVEGNFRQEEIAMGWEKFGFTNKDVEFQKYALKVECSKGTYIRQLTFDLGEKLGCGAFCLSIKRVQVGDIGEKECVRMTN